MRRLTDEQHASRPKNIEQLVQEDRSLIREKMLPDCIQDDVVEDT
jgi:hypothetical protein